MDNHLPITFILSSVVLAAATYLNISTICCVASQLLSTFATAALVLVAVAAPFGSLIAAMPVTIDAMMLRLASRSSLVSLALVSLKRPASKLLAAAPAQPRMAC